MAKLVRDNIPVIISNSGRSPVVHICDSEEYSIRLKDKLLEEAKEFCESNSIEELADVLEVVEAIAKECGVSIEEILQIKKAKQDKNGAFNKKICLDEVIG